MERRYRAGQTLEQIGQQYKMTRERVRQVISELGVKAVDGGAHLLGIRRRAERAAQRDARFMRRYGCTFDQYRSVCQKGWSAERRGRERTPMGAFLRQRCTAKGRGIEFKFKFWDWWLVWEKSGHWHERGRGRGYVMARFNDAGPYSPENVKIVLAAENVAEYYDRERATHGRVRSGQERKAA
jgi:hypothetical protein